MNTPASSDDKKSGLLEKAIGHFNQLKNKNMERLYVEEWGAFIYCRPCLKVSEQAELLKYADSQKYDELLFHTMRLKACDELGHPIFKVADMFDVLNNVDQEVVTRVVNWLNNPSRGISREDLEKN